MNGTADTEATHGGLRHDPEPPAPLDGCRVVRSRCKRAVDVAVALALLVLLLPLLILTAVAVFLEDRGPILYRQRRVGFHNREFCIFKFRSMVSDADQRKAALRPRNMSDGLLFKVHGDPRVTRVGRIIRRTSIDELPQLLNVVRGEMSLVGPRPLLARPEDFDTADSRRHTVRPGITGFWQVSGGSALGYRDMIDLDLAYIRNWSWRLDLWIVVRTVPALLRRGDC